MSIMHFVINKFTYTQTKIWSWRLITRLILHLFSCLHTCNSWHLSRRQALNIATFNEFHFSNFPIHFHYTSVDFQLITCNLWRYSTSPSKPVGDKERSVSPFSYLLLVVFRRAFRCSLYLFFFKIFKRKNTWKRIQVLLLLFSLIQRQCIPLSQIYFIWKIAPRVIICIIIISF